MLGGQPVFLQTMPSLTDRAVLALAGVAVGVSLASLADNTWERWELALRR